jgi:alkanesulfonate monooxygenase SsuD/methylene tetrahydromethanopterin reductase-like flavin-dependent oxidoreductase (luciferase family)
LLRIGWQWPPRRPRKFVIRSRRFKETKMKFAHFSHIWAKPGMTPHQRYEELWRELQLCDDLGYDYAFCVEHHFRPDESWISSPSLYAVGAGARTKRLRIGPMGYIVPLYHPLRLAEEIAVVDQMLGGRMECGLVPGINADYFRPFGLDYDLRKTPTLEFVSYLRAAFGETQPFSFSGDNFHTAEPTTLAVQPVQKPHPPLWMMSRDPRTLEFCAANGVNPGYFLVYPRADAAPRYRVFLDNWKKAEWKQKPQIAYCTLVYVDETDQKATDVALARAARAYEGFLPPPKPGETFDERVREHSKKFIGRGEPGASEIMRNLFDADYLMKHELVFIGSADTVARKLRAAAETGVFNVFLGEFNFTDVPADDVMRSIRLFGERVIPVLRGYEPF